MFTQIPFIAIVALGVSFPLETGNVDISTGRVAGFAGIVHAAASAASILFPSLRGDMPTGLAGAPPREPRD